MVTGKTEAEAAQMGASLRSLANEMKVTSTELAQAAVTFYRQGLNDTQVNDRLRWVTMYSKVANIDFDTAATLITASTNAMQLQDQVEKVVDVFLYLGDAAATSGEEIGTAMQKASASATEFGVSFEWLGTYIATVAEQTRQAPQTIGNAFNSMMARMHTMRQTGYNEEDETRINDVAKALATVNIALMDSEGNWRDMDQIFIEVAQQWGNMTDKQKSYIATTLAGIRQQNVFFALMNDMSKGIEGGSRAWELYTGALEAAGTATEKFSVWQESIAASQSQMNVALEQLYSNLQPGAIKGFYDVVTWFVEGLTTMGDLALWGAIAAGIFVVKVAIDAFAAEVVTAGGVMAATATVFQLHPLFATATIIVGILTLTGIIGGFVNAVNDAGEAIENTSRSYEEISKEMNDVQSLQNRVNATFEKLQSGVGLTEQEMVAYTADLKQISKLSPQAASAVGKLTSNVEDQQAAYDGVNQAIQDYLELSKKQRQAAAITQLGDWQQPEEATLSGGYFYSRDFILSHMAGYDPSQSYGDQFSSNYRNVLRYWLEEGKEIQNVGNDVIRKLTKEAAQNLGYTLDANILGDDAKMGLLTNAVWQLLFGYEGERDNRLRKIDDAADELVALGVQVYGETSSKLEQQILTETLKKRVMIDGQLITDANQWLLRDVLHFLDNPESLMTPQVVMQTIAKNLFGAEASSYLVNAAEASALSDAVRQSYEDAIAAGLTDADLSAALRSYWSSGQGAGNISDLADSLSWILWDAISQAMGSESTVEYEYINEGANWGPDINAQRLMLSLLQLGKTKEDIDKAFAESSS